MIFTDRTITIRNDKSTINEPVVLYRGDYEVSIRFTIMESKFRFKSGVNLVDSEKASFGQLAILSPYGGNVFSEVVKCEDGTVTFTLTKEMIDQLEEVGLYSFQIRLFDYYRESRVSIPPVEFGIEVREPVASEDHDNTVSNAIVGYSIAKVVDGLSEDVPDTFDSNGQYNKTDWETGDRISQGKLNKIEDALDKINQNEKNDVAALDKRITGNFNVLDNTKAELNDLKVLETRVDSLTHLQEGSTTGDAELIDARIEYNGAVNATVGGAIRNQVSDIHGIFDVIVNKSNLYSTAPVVHGKIFDYGTERDGGQYSYFKVEVRAGVTYYMYPGIRLYCMMNYDGEVVDRSDKEYKEMFSYTPSVSGFLYVTVYTIRIETSKMATTSDMDSVGNYGEAFTLSDNISIYDHRDIKDIHEHIDSFFTSNNLLDDALYYPGYFHRAGFAKADSSYAYFIVNLEPGEEYVIYPRCRMIDWYTDTGTYHSFDESMSRQVGDIIITVPETNNVSIAYITVYMSEISAVRLYKNDGRTTTDVTAFGTTKLNENVSIEENDSIKDIYEEIKDLQSIIIDNNLIKPSEIVEGYYFNSHSTILPSSNYFYCKVNLKAGVTYHMYPRIRIIRVYSKYGTSIYFNDSTCDNGQPFEFTPSLDCEAYVTFYSRDKTSAFISEESNPSLVVASGHRKLADDIIVENAANAVDMDTANQGNILYKKKWAVIGDSFTYGDFSGYTDANGLTGKNSPELYDAELEMYKTYPWWIMKRNNMTLQKFYMGGRTLATPADGTFTNSITYNDMYKQIDADVDYITIYLGINDGHHMPGSTGDDGEDKTGSIPIGTETDETTATFYGAWNVLLRDLITLYPFAHIGILVSNGMDTDEHVNATIKMAKKWGIPYLNLDSGYDVPLLIRSRPNCRPETCAEAIELRKNQQRVSSSNGHPNHLAHKYESTFIEDFLRRI